MTVPEVGDILFLMNDLRLHPSRPEQSERVRKRLRLCTGVSYGPLVLPFRTLLSPLAGFTNLPFRRVVHELGGLGLGTTDLVNARGLLAGSEKTLRLIATHPIDRPFAVQIFGGEASIMRDAAQFLEARGVDSIDINMGCPVPKVVKTGAGASLMCHADAATELVKAVVEAVKVPVTVKMRLGWDATQLTAPRFAREFEQVGVAAVAIHGRTRAQGFSGTVNRDGIRQVVEAVDSIPVIANGDIRSVDDAIAMYDETGCQAISIGRGALANPWIFRQLTEWETTGDWAPAGSFNDRLLLMRRQFRYLQEWVGEETAVSAFRKMSHWYTKAMRVGPALRHAVQSAKTGEEFEQALQEIALAGPRGATKDGLLPDFEIPVPSGPNEHW